LCKHQIGIPQSQDQGEGRGYIFWVLLTGLASHHRGERKEKPKPKPVQLLLAAFVVFSQFVGAGRLRFAFAFALAVAAAVLRIAN